MPPPPSTSASPLLSGSSPSSSYPPLPPYPPPLYPPRCATASAVRASPLWKPNTLAIGTATIFRMVTRRTSHLLVAPSIPRDARLRRHCAASFMVTRPPPPPLPPLHTGLNGLFGRICINGLVGLIGLNGFFGFIGTNSLIGLVWWQGVVAIVRVVTEIILV